MQKIFLVVPPGLENVSHNELSELTLSGNHKYNYKPAGENLEYECDLVSLLHANNNLRVPNRILVRLGDFTATNFPELVKKASRINWENFIPGNSMLSIRTTCKKSKLYHSDAVSQRIQTSIEKRLAQKLSFVKSSLEDEAEKDVQIIVVRIINDRVEISIDSSGIPLYKRGYRQALTKAPLRENLAAAMIIAAQWDSSKPLMDPFCGSGTIPIEAALIKNHIPPGYNRHFIMEKWPIFLKESKYFEPKNIEKNFQIGESNIYGSDRDAGAIQISLDNCLRANSSDSIIWNQHAFSDMPDLKEPGWIVTNPPYGQRINSGHDLRNLYAQFGNVLRKRFMGWKVLFICSDQGLVNQTQLEPEVVLSFSNGGIGVKAYYTEIN